MLKRERLYVSIKKNPVDLNHFYMGGSTDG